MFEKEVYRYTVSCGAPRAGKYVTKEEAMKQRLDKAEDEAKKDVYPLEKITTIVIEFLEKVGCENPVSLEIKNIADFLTPRIRSRKYNQLKEKYDLNNRKHLVWMKFTTDGYIGVVAASDDINFDMDNTSGKIIDHLNKNWNQDFVLVFPLSNIGDKERSDIECGIGNYLIDKDVLILDFYSHQYK